MIEELTTENALLKQTVISLEMQLKRMEEQLNYFKKMLFGKRSEKFLGGDNQLLLPGLEDYFQPQEEPAKKVHIEAHDRAKSPKAPINTISFPEDLPVERVELDISEKDKIDPTTGEALVCIGEEVSRKLAKKPASYFIKEYARKKYAHANKSEEGIKTASLPDSIITRCAVDESVLADVITKKFCDHSPLYRQAEMMLRDRVKISRQTLGSYVSQIGKALLPLYQLLEAEIKTSGNIFVDETPVDILAPGKGKTKQGYMLVVAGGASSNPALRVYKFLETRKHDAFAEVFKGYTGVFHSDKYSAYEKEAKNMGKIWAPCYAHIRRKYVESETDPKFRDEILTELQKLFLIEEEIKELSCEERLRIRKEKAEPIIDLLLHKNKERLKSPILPKSKIALAVGYFLGLAPYLKNYLYHPYSRLDNNVAERALKLVVIGRKNWLFVGSEGGGEASAVIYSLAQSCRALGINPYNYFDDILRRIQSHTYNKLGELLPHNWKPI